MKVEFLKAMEQLLDQKLEAIHDQLAVMDNKLDLLVEGQPDDIGACGLSIRSWKHEKEVEFTFLKTSQNELEINRLKHQ